MNNRTHPRFRLLALLLLWLPLAVVGREPEPAPPHVDYVIGLSPFLERSVKDDVYRRIVAFLLEEMPLESSLGLYDAYHLRSISRVEVPGARAFVSSKTRANQFREPVRKLREFLGATHEFAGPTNLPFAGAVRFPQFMDFVGEHLAQSNRAAVVVLLGSPLYLDPKEPGFSMLDGYFPSDGHLAATRDETVYGLKERRGSLEGIVVHFGYFGDPWVSEVHAEKITRFWALYLKGQGGQLGAFCGDLATVFKAARGNGAERRAMRAEVDPAQKKIEMLRVTRNIGMADWITRDTLPVARPRPPRTTLGPVKIGIRWQGALDLDLYAKPHRSGETLFFQHTRCPEGYYFKDHRSSPEREFEFIEFETPVDLREVEAMINFYEGFKPGGPRGEVRVEFEGQIFTGAFALAADHGNQGRTGPRQRDHWTRIDIPRLLGLEAPQTTAQRTQ